MARSVKGTAVAVLTGDLVRSTALSHEGLLQARESLRRAAREIAGWGRGAVHGPDFFRGDSWQLVLTQPNLWLRAVLYLRTTLRALEEDADTRISVGVGAMDALDADAVSQSTGEAFVLSGRALDDMSRFEGFRLATAQPEPDETYLPTVLSFCSHVVGGWSSSQAKVALEMLRPLDKTQEALADALGVSRQFVSKVHRQYGLSSVMMALDVFEGRA
ncbi:hypothetical protein [Brevundimonas bacteroides]|uniref:hypothetical protein n=1 Tax=Brevundimonas bacteroides TaxID=74311 RepID=UPI00049537DE|nr:hypothetical protein [Brevundimonas bacteroides]